MAMPGREVQLMLGYCGSTSVVELAPGPAPKSAPVGTVGDSAAAARASMM